MTILGGKGLERVLSGEENPETKDSRIWIDWRPGESAQQYLKSGGLNDIKTDSGVEGNILWDQLPDDSVKWDETDGQNVRITKNISPQESAQFIYQTELGKIVIIVRKV